MRNLHDKLNDCAEQTDQVNPQPSETLLRTYLTLL